MNDTHTYEATARPHSPHPPPPTPTHRQIQTYMHAHTGAHTHAHACILTCTAHSAPEHALSQACRVTCLPVRQAGGVTYLSKMIETVGVATPGKHNTQLTSNLATWQGNGGAKCGWVGWGVVGGGVWWGGGERVLGGGPMDVRVRATPRSRGTTSLRTLTPIPRTVIPNPNHSGTYPLSLTPYPLLSIT